MGGLQVVTEGRRPGTVRSFLDSTQYSTTSILRYERIFGSGFVSTGGIETTKVQRSAIKSHMGMGAAEYDWPEASSKSCRSSEGNAAALATLTTRQ
jgi:hypothetical protein